MSVFVMDVPRDGDDAVRLTSMVRELRTAGARIVEGAADADQLVDLAAAELLGRLDKDVPDDRLGNLVLREISAHRLREGQYAARPTLKADALAHGRR